MKCTLLTTDNEKKDLEINDFHALYGVIDTDLLQVINISKTECMIVDEEGKHKNKAINEYACEIFHGAGGSLFDFIVGDAVICPTKLLN